MGLAASGLFCTKGLIPQKRPLLSEGFNRQPEVIMRTNTRLLVLAAALIAPIVGLRADEPCCPASKAKTTSTTQCTAAKGQYVLVKIKGGGDASLDKAIGKLEGVTTVETCTESKFTKIGYSKEKVCGDSVLAALKDAGYKVETQRVTYSVAGISCRL